MDYDKPKKTTLIKPKKDKIYAFKKASNNNYFLYSLFTFS